MTTLSSSDQHFDGIRHIILRIKNDDKVWLIDPKGKLYQWIEKLSQLLAHSDTLFIIDDIIADEEFGKKGCPY